MNFNFNKTVLIIVFKGIIISGCAPEPEDENALRTTDAGSSRLSELLRDDTTDQFPKAVEQREFRFPDDHGPHPEFRNEWWYFTGNLTDSDERRFGYELTLFRFALAPDVAETLDSAWQTRQVYIGHFAVTDVAGKEFHVDQRYSRGAAGLAGATTAPVRIWIDDWAIDFDATDDQWQLSASGDGVAIGVTLDPVKPVVLNGANGLSQKSAEPGNASYYYSVPRLETVGDLQIGEDTFRVTGNSWLDREWGSSALSREQRGWDWFALQLSDGSDLMFYQIRQSDGQTDLHSSGTFIEADGRTVPLRRNDVRIEVESMWHSERGGSYPSAWRIEIPSRQLSLSVLPVLENQELITNVRYWEGAVDVAGQVSGQEITGRGYVELTGYADP